MTPENEATFRRLTHGLLSPKLLVVMRLVVEGLESNEIADKLGIKRDAVDKRRGMALSALNVKNTSEFLCQIIAGAGQHEHDRQPSRNLGRGQEHGGALAAGQQ
jgi:DNA-binding NarL/FixJ family response regulator